MRSILLVTVFLFSLWESHANAKPLALQPAPTAMNRAVTPAHLLLPEPVLGRQHKAKSGLNVGVISQAQTTGTGDPFPTEVVVIGLVVGLLGLALFITILVGNIRAAVTHQHKVGWGIAGTVLFGISSIFSLVNMGNPTPGLNTGTSMGITLAGLAINLGLLGFSIWNMVTGLREEKLRKQLAIAPWVLPDVQGRGVSGGLLFQGSF